MFCTKCGANIKEGARFCESCGNPLLQDDSQLAAPAAPPAAPPPPEIASKKKSKLPLVLSIAGFIVVGAIIAVFFIFFYKNGDSNQIKIPDIPSPLPTNTAPVNTPNSPDPTATDAPPENTAGLPLPSIPPVESTPPDNADSTTDSPNPAPSVIVERILITPLEARGIVQTWLENHPFQLGAILVRDENLFYDEIQGEDYEKDGEEYYLFYVSIIRLGVASILVHNETGELFHLDSPYNSVGFASIDDWYESDHAAYAPPLCAYDAWVVYDVWMEDFQVMSDFSVDLHSYDIYEVDGEYYYWFKADNEEWYWYNILVNMQPGEMLFMMISDGEEPVVEIELLQDFYERNFV